MSTLDGFHLCERGSGAAPMRLGLNLKHAHENWDQHKAVMHVLANKAHVNTWVIMCKQ